jgi:hypothetical protein
MTLFLATESFSPDATTINTCQTHSSQEMIGLARQIRKCGKDVDSCLDLVRQYVHPSPENLEIFEPVLLEALNVVSQAQKKGKTSKNIQLDFDRQQYHQKLLKIALDLFDQCPTEACRARTISVCGRKKEGFPLAMKLFQSSQCEKSLPTINAALAACSVARDWKGALNIFNDELLSKDRMSASTLACNIVLTAMERSKKGQQAFMFLRSMIDGQTISDGKPRMPLPDRNSFHHTMNALVAENKSVPHGNGNSTHTNLDLAFNLLAEMTSVYETYAKNGEFSVLPNNVTLDILSSAYSRVGNWKMTDRIESLRGSSLPVIAPNLHLGNDESSSFFLRWAVNEDGMQKVGKGRGAYWIFASYRNNDVDLIAALQPHRNPSKNGIKILLFDANYRVNKQKLGYLLMINDVQSGGSSKFLGMFIEPKMRNLGLSKVFLSIWLDLCLMAEIRPTTGIINKPLLVLILQHTFNFRPLYNADAQNGVEVMIGKGQDGKIELYSSSTKNLHGAFTAGDQERENIRLLTTAPLYSGRLCRVGAAFVNGEDSREKCDLRKIICQELKGNDGSGILTYNSRETPWKRILLGSKD